MGPFIFFSLGSLLVDGTCFLSSKELLGSMSVLTPEVLADRGDEKHIKTYLDLS